MRLDFTVEIYDRWLGHFEPNFLAEGVEFEEAWVGFQAGDHHFMFGRMKEPFSLEEMSSTRHIDPINFSVLNQFVPSEDHGITVLGKFGDVDYGLGFYNGTGGDDTNSDKDVAARLVVHPWRGLQLGGAATYGRQNLDIGGDELRTEARVPIAEFVPGTRFDGPRSRLGSEAAYLEGPLALTAEVMARIDEVNGASVRLSGGYLQASYVLTGEEKTWNGVKPAHPFRGDPDAGAWQVVARWSRLNLDDRLAPFLSNFPDRMDSYTAGVTWYANDFVKIKVNFLRTQFRRAVVLDGDSFRREDALLFQFQFQF
jgi:phosphate-selective porin OprO/OprP